MPGPMAPLGPIGAMEPDWRDIKANLRPRIVSMDGAEASPLFEAPTEGELSLVMSWVFDFNTAQPNFSTKNTLPWVLLWSLNMI